MKIQILLVALVALSFAADIERDEGVIIGTEDNFQELLDTHDKVLVEFYAPWCGHCKKLAPEYAAAAEILSADNIDLVKVDATENGDLAKKFGVSGYPTLKWFVGGEPSDYNGGRTTDEIVSWINKRMGPPSTEVDAATLATKIEASKIAVVFFGDSSSDEFKTFEKAAGLDDKRAFFHTADADAAKTHEVEGTKVVLFRSFDEPKVTFEGDFETAALTKFVEDNSVPTLIEFSDEYIEPIFQKQQPALFFFKDPASEEHKKIEENFSKAATELKGRIFFSTSGTSEGIQARLAEFVGVTAEDVPLIVLIEFGAGGVKKFRFTGDSTSFTVEEISTFLDDWKANKLEIHLKSEEIPETNDEPVKVLVGKNWNEIVRDSEDDVLVEFYAPWCGHCKSLAPKYDELAADLKDVEGLVIAKIDSTGNEIEGVSISGFPTLKFFAKGSKRAPQDYDGEREVDGFKDWLKNNSAAYKTYLEKKDDL